MSEETLCIKCDSAPIFHQKHKLCDTCYRREYRKGNIPKDPSLVWNENSPYNPDTWLKQLDVIKLPVKLELAFDPMRDSLILIIPSKKEYQKNLSLISNFKAVFKDITFEVRDDVGNYITRKHEFVKEEKQPVVLKV